MRVLPLAFALAVSLGSSGVAHAMEVDARSCAVRFRALGNIYSYALNEPAMYAKSKQYGERAVEVLVKAGTLKAGEALPKDVSDDAAAYVRAWRAGTTADNVVSAEIRACELANGYSPIG